MRTADTSSGGSSGKSFPDSLPSGAARIFECMSPLDKDWLDDKLGLFSALSTSGSRLVDIDVPVQSHVDLVLIFEEFSTSSIPSALILLICRWLYCRVANIIGRKEVKEEISNFFESAALSATVDTSFLSVPMALPAPSAAQHPAPAPPSLSFSQSLVFDEYPVKCHNRAMQILRPYSLSFDGINSVERYLLFKSQVQQVCLSESAARNHVQIEIVISCLRNSALDAARSLTHLYSMDPVSALKALWDRLDALYDSADARRHLLSMYHNIKQSPDESLPAFLSRLRILVKAVANMKTLDDAELIVKLDTSLTDSVAILARGLLQTLNIESFDRYSTQLLATTNSLAPFNPKPNLKVPHNAAHVSDSCLRCGSAEHSKSSCSRKVIYPCKFCQSMEHYSRVCEKGDKKRRSRSNSRFRAFERKPSPSPAAQSSNNVIRPEHSSTPQQQESSIREELNDINLSFGCSNLVSIITVDCCANSVGVDPRLIDTADPKLTVTISSDVNAIKQDCLYDTGAGANFISFSFAQTLIKQRIVEKASISTLATPITITYGNSSKEHADCVLPIRVRLDSDKSMNPHSVELLAIVTRSSSFPMILGRTGLKQLGLWHSPSPQPIFPIVNFSSCDVSPSVDSKTFLVPQRSPLVEVTPENRLQIRHSFLENATIMPYRAPRRPRSLNDLSIIHCKLMQMVKQGKVVECQSRDAHMIHEVVLVDKLVQKRLPRIDPGTDPELLRRYRITLDLRCANDLKLIQTEGGGCALVPNKFANNITNKTLDNSDRQHQTNAVDIIKQLPHGLTIFAKLDLDDAFSSVLLPPNLRSMFCYMCVTPQGAKFFQWNCLVQGWKYSPLFFTIAVQFVLDQCEQLIPEHTYIRHYQDDILIAGYDLSKVNIAMNVVMKKLNYFGFSVNEQKTKVSDHTVFCGYKLTSSGMTPFPKTPVTNAFADSAWLTFENARSSETRLSLLRQWSGRFNYYLGFLPPEQLKNLRFIYNCTSLLMRDPLLMDAATTKSLSDSFKGICSFIANGSIPTFPCGYINDTILTIIVTDANADSYAGILFRLCRVQTKVNDDEMPEIRSLLEAIKNQISFDADVSELLLLPVRIIGGEFTQSEMKQSSTYRERLCQMRCVDQFYTIIYGRCILVSDNQNTGRNWHHLDETLTYGSNLVPWMKLQSCVSDTIWVPRGNSIVTLADFIARSIAPHRPESIAVPLAHFGVSEGSIPSSLSLPSSLNPRLPKFPISIKRELTRCYVDDKSTYLRTKLSDIYVHLVHNTPVDSRTSNLARRFIVVEDVLYHIGMLGSLHIYVPTGGNIELSAEVRGSLRASVLFHYHDLPTSCHRGHRKMLYEMSSIFWWPGMNSDILTYVNTCLECQKVKSRFTKFKGGIRSISAAQPLQSWIVDFAGPMRFDDSDFRYIFVALCAYSSYAVVAPALDLSAATCAEIIFEKIISVFGIPSNIYSDRGSSFDNELMSTICRKLGIVWRLSASYSPRTQGLVERYICHIKESLRLTSPSVPQLQAIQVLHNTSCIGDSLMSPHEIIFGIRANVSPLFSQGNVFEEDADDITTRMNEARLAWESYRRYMRDRNADIYASRSIQQEFKPGDQVFRVYLTERFSERVRTSGPHTVIERVSNQYVISDYHYPIPEYQLRPSLVRPSELAVQVPPSEVPQQDPASPAAIDVSTVQPGDLVVFSSFENYDGGVISYDVGEWIERIENTARLTRYWYDDQGCWRRWDDEVVECSIDDIKAVKFKLTKSLKLPSSIMNVLVK